MENKEDIHIALGLKPSYCGKSIEKQLMKIIKEESLKRYGNKKLTLNVRKFNKRAIKCYWQAGFRVYDENEDFIKMVYIIN